MDGGGWAWPSASAGAWFIIRTRSRQEKILARELCARGIACFLPLVAVARLYAGREATVQSPLFAGWLFLRGQPDHAQAAHQTNRAAEVVRVPDQQRLDAELRSLHLAVSAGAALTHSPCLPQGIRAQVRDGPLRGLRGVIETADRRDRIILQVQVLGQAASVAVDPSLVTVLD